MSTLFYGTTAQKTYGRTDIKWQKSLRSNSTKTIDKLLENRDYNAVNWLKEMPFSYIPSFLHSGYDVKEYDKYYVMALGDIGVAKIDKSTFAIVDLITVYQFTSIMFLSEYIIAAGIDNVIAISVKDFTVVNEMDI